LIWCCKRHACPHTWHNAAAPVPCAGSVSWSLRRASSGRTWSCCSRQRGQPSRRLRPLLQRRKQPPLRAWSGCRRRSGRLRRRLRSCSGGCTSRHAFLSLQICPARPRVNVLQPCKTHLWNAEPGQGFSKRALLHVARRRTLPGGRRALPGQRLGRASKMRYWFFVDQRGIQGHPVLPAHDPPGIPTLCCARHLACCMANA
jgi:hypothetical protein